jgi:hypothetical protein
MRFSRPILALSVSALSVLALASAALVGGNRSAQAQVPGCADAPSNGIIPRCLVVTKQTLPNGSPGNFTISATIDPPAAPNMEGSESLSDGESVGIPLGANITPTGTIITLTEDVPAGWELVSASCDGAGITTAPTTDGVVVTYTGDLGPNDPFGYGVCTFTNERVATSTPTVTPTTGTTTPTATATTTGTPSTATPTATATPFYTNINNPPPGGLGGLFQPNPQPTRTAVPQQVAPTTPSTVRPPSTGDGGLK